MNGNRQRILTVRGLCKAYGSGESRVEALRNIDLDIYDGELLTILGSSGSGKSTLRLPFFVRRQEHPFEYAGGYGRL